MINKLIVSTLCNFLLLASINANSAIIDNDTYTTVTSTGLDWLDLTETSNRSYADINAQLAVGGEFEGWRYASFVDIKGLLDAFGGAGAYGGWAESNNGVVSAISPLWADLICLPNDCGFGFIYRQAGTSGNIRTGSLYDQTSIDVFTRVDSSLAMDYINILGYLGNIGLKGNHALVRDASVVPVPAAIWLFGSGLIGLIGAARCKKA